MSARTTKTISYQELNCQERPIVFFHVSAHAWIDFSEKFYCRSEQAFPLIFAYISFQPCHISCYIFQRIFSHMIFVKKITPLDFQEQFVNSFTHDLWEVLKKIVLRSGWSLLWQYDPITPHPQRWSRWCQTKFLYCRRQLVLKCLNWRQLQNLSKTSASKFGPNFSNGFS